MQSKEAFFKRREGKTREDLLEELHKTSVALERYKDERLRLQSERDHATTQCRIVEDRNQRMADLLREHGIVPKVLVVKYIGCRHEQDDVRYDCQFSDYECDNCEAYDENINVKSQAVFSFSVCDGDLRYTDGEFDNAVYSDVLEISDMKTGNVIWKKEDDDRES